MFRFLLSCAVGLNVWLFSFHLQEPPENLVLQAVFWDCCVSDGGEIEYCCANCCPTYHFGCAGCEG